MQFKFYKGENYGIQKTQCERGAKLYRHNIKGSGSDYIYYFSLICNIQEEFTVSSLVDYIRKEGDNILIYGYATRSDGNYVYMLLKIAYDINYGNTGVIVYYRRGSSYNDYASNKFDTLETDKVYEL